VCVLDYWQMVLLERFVRVQRFSAHSGSRVLAQEGFTLIELVVVLTVLTVISSIAVSKFRPIESSFQRMNARSLLIQDLKRAQAEAITWGCRGIFAIADDSSGYSFGCDFLEYDTSTAPAADRVFFTRKMPTGISITASQPVIFNSRGQSVDLDGVMVNVDVDLQDYENDASTIFASGTLLGTGVFSYAD
jgi:prepilin-type N-terminal cleavage/methylation domain-containing protein